MQYLCVDHDHRAKNVRGLPCNACNTAIGLFEEDPRRLRDAVAYLRKHAAHREGTRTGGGPAQIALAFE